LIFAQWIPDLLVWIRWVWLTQVHRHVDVVALRLERCVEDRLVHPWVASVDDDVGFRLLDQALDRGLVSRVDVCRREFRPVVELTDCFLSSSK